ncbi:MAG: D-alanyl-D-alanine carboxypeptidase [Limnohabitans sp.]|nr:D-alanyl-D-alanine carboxypeptidase [Limnohabitans sp.]
MKFQSAGNVKLIGFNNSIKQVLFIIVIGLFFAQCKSINYSQKKSPSQTFFDTVSQTFTQDPIFNNAQLGVLLYDISNQKTVFKLQEHKFFIPASTLKLFTTLAAVSFIKDSLNGFLSYETNDTLFLLPLADPSFLDPRFPQIISEKISKTSKTIAFLYYPNTIKTYGYGWSWDEYDEDYMPERSLLPIHQNLVKIQYQKDSIITYPKYFSNNVSVEKTTSKFLAFSRQRFQNKFFSRPSNYTFASTYIPFIVGDSLQLPTAILAAEFPDKNICNLPFRPNNQNLKALKTQNLDSLIKTMLLESDNFIAEQLLINIGLQDSTMFSESFTIQKTLNNYPITNKNAPLWLDGSGLSRYNLVTPTHTLQVLLSLDSLLPQDRLNNLVSTGNRGTLKGLYTKYPQNIHAKTGTLSNNLALAGYINTLKNKRFAFVIMVGNHREKNGSIRRVIENYLNKIIEAN